MRTIYSLVWKVFAVSILCVVLFSCSGNGDSNPVTSPPPNAMTVTVGDNFFNPATITVPPGTTVVWRNDGNMGHTVTSGSPNARIDLFDSPTLSNGNKFQFTFSQAGTVPYYCRIHGFAMSGTVIVQEGASTGGTGGTGGGGGY